MINKEFDERFPSFSKSLDDVFKEIKQFINQKLKEEYKRGFNDCLKEQGKTGERWQHLYL